MEGTSDTAAAVLLALLSTVILAGLHLLSPRIRKLPLVPEAATVSFAGGLAVSYVFLHLLPELAQGHIELRELFGETEAPSPLTELGIFLVALVGFCIFYGLERLAESSTSTSPEPRATRTGTIDSSDDTARQTRNPSRAPVATQDRANSNPSVASRRAFSVHLGFFMLYNAVITYTLPLTYRTGIWFAVLFTVAMGLHFVLSDRGLEEHYGPLFSRWTPRLLLAGALLAGWALAALFAPTRTLTVSLITAFLAGSVLLNVFKEEIPTARRSSLPWFLTGLGLYALLLGTATAFGAE